MSIGGLIAAGSAWPPSSVATAWCWASHRHGRSVRPTCRSWSTWCASSVSAPTSPCPRSISSRTAPSTPSPLDVIRHAESAAITPGLLDRLDREELQGHRPRTRPCGQLRHPLQPAGRRPGRSIALLADMLARMTIWGGMGRGRRGWWWRTGGHPRHRPGGGHPARSAVLCRWPWSPARSSGRRQQRGADAQSIRAGTGPGQADARREARGRPGRPSIIVYPVKKLDKSARGFSTDPGWSIASTARKLTGQPEIDEAARLSLPDCADPSRGGR